MKVKPIKDFPGYYVSDTGKVFSYKKPGCKGGLWDKRRELSPGIDNIGRANVSLWRDGEQHMRRVHRLILETFVGPCPEGLEACHGPNGVRDNSLKNLRWDTRQSNQMDRVRDGTSNRGTRNGMSKLSQGQAKVIKLLAWKDKPENVARVFKVSRWTVYDIWKNRRWGWV